MAEGLAVVISAVFSVWIVSVGTFVTLDVSFSVFS